MYRIHNEENQFNKMSSNKKMMVVTFGWVGFLVIAFILSITLITLFTKIIN
jgi:hypothetical protein